ncbi:MAG: sigma-54-dependent Fis family transcriptional regulator [Acidobacteria bacterium]|nr:sigma-54-dependent Fis family transcriptional regulator [Acidobacteriota bacterium]
MPAPTTVDLPLRMEPTVLVVDDDPAAVEFLRTVLSQATRTPRYRVTTANSGFRAEQACRTYRPAVVLLDLVLPDADGIDVLRALKAIDQGLEVIIISGQGTLKRALEAGQAGAFFFLDKSDLDPLGLLGLVDRAANLVHERRQHQWLHGKEQEQHTFENILGRSKPMHALFELVEAVAQSDANVLIQGENGTGKELFANALHQRSQRARGPFIKINCAALPKDLIESELFGYKKGSFTGANADKVGLLELSRGGSLMLDEIGEMPALLQTKLLRVLQEREFRPIGSDRSVQVDFRLICATNVDLDAALADGRLREDLYFRINTITMKVPPLRERPEDIPLLCSHFLHKFNQRYHKSLAGISPAAYQLLMRFRWPGNVRELENAIERAVLVAKGTEVQPQDLPESMRDDGPVTTFAVPPHHTLAEIERLTILQTLQRTNWNKQEAANILGLYRPTLYSKMRRHAIRDPRAVAAEEAEL